MSVSEYILASLSAYAGTVAIPVALAGLAFTERGWDLLSWTTRRARTTVRSSDGSCEERCFEQLNSGPLHQCTLMWPAQCHGKSHVPGPRCWVWTLTTVINNWGPAAATAIVEKPRALPVSKQYVHVDLRTVFAFIFTAARNDAKRERHQVKKEIFRIGDVAITIDKLFQSDVVLLHLEGTLQRTLTKSYVEDLLHNYPPLAKDPRGVSVVHAGDEKRGGWVAALGLEDPYDEKTAFLPVYLDCVSYKHRRGRVFWRSMDRVREILVDIWAKAFDGVPAASRVIASAIKALEHISERETESGVNRIFDCTLPSPPLSSQQKARIIAHFNGPPLIGDGELQQFRSDWAPLLQYVLVAAVRGSVRCIAYFKNEGRELENILPMELLRSSELYLRGC